MRDLLLAVAASGIIRNAHYLVPNGKTIPERTLLHEAGAENLCVRSQEFDHASWAKGAGVTVTANATVAPDGTTTADRLLSSGVGDVSVSQLIPFTADGEKGWSVHLRGGTAAQTAFSIYDSTVGIHRHIGLVSWTAGVPSLSTNGGSGRLFTPQLLKNGFRRIAITANGVIAANANLGLIYPAGGGAAAGDVYAWGTQAVNSNVLSSYIATLGAAVTRAADTLYLPHTNVPQAGTLYVRFIELGMASAGGSQGVASIGEGNNASIFLLTSGAGTYYAINRQAADQSTGVINPGPVIGDAVELLLQIAPSGALTLRQRINDGAEVVSSPSAAQALAGSYSAPRIYMGSRGPGSEGNYAFTHAAFVTDAQSWETMRQVAGRR